MRWPGERVAVVGAPHRAAREVFEALRRHVPAEVFVDLHRANGLERLEVVGGGSVDFRPGGRGSDFLRGTTFDRVYLVGWHPFDESVHRDARIATLTSSAEGRKVVRL